MTEDQQNKFRQWWEHWVATKSTMTVEDVLRALSDILIRGEVEPLAPHIIPPGEETITPDDVS